MAVLDLLRDEGLQDNARKVRTYAKAGLAKLAERHEIIGGICGYGLFFGAEMVRTVR